MKHSKSIDITLATTVIILGVVSLALLVFLRDFNDNNRRPSKPSSIGTIVEVYNKEHSYFAIPAIIIDEIISTSSSPSNDASTSYRSYNLQNSITNEIITNVNEEHIHPYTIYKDGTIASCNFSTLRNNVHLMTPCAIVSSSTGSSPVPSFRRGDNDVEVEVEDGTKKSNSKMTVTYQVAYLNEENILSYVNDLPYNRVQRRRHLHFPYKIQ